MEDLSCTAGKMMVLFAEMGEEEWVGEENLEVIPSKYEMGIAY